MRDAYTPAPAAEVDPAMGRRSDHRALATRRLAALVAGLALSSATFAQAAEPSSTQSAKAEAASKRSDGLPDWAPKPKPRVVEDRFRIEVMGLGASFETNLRIDESPTQLGTEINAEEDLGLDDSYALPLVELTLLPGKRHMIRMSGLNTRRSAQKVIEKEIIFDDEVYVAGEYVDSTLNLAMFGLTYGYRFVVRDRAELTATLGVQITEVEANAVVRSRVLRDTESTVAPLPLLGIEGRYDFTNRFGAEARVQYLSAEVDDVDGSILDARLALTWRLNPYLVFGLGYRSFAIEVDSRDEQTPGYFDFNIDGPQLYMRASL